MARDLAAGSALTGDARGAAAAFRADPGDWLPLPARRRGLGIWTVALHAPLVSRQIACRLGDPWVTKEGALWRSIRWEPEPERDDPLPFAGLLPTFHGEVGVDLAGQSVRVQGRYRPPGGRVGALLDGALQAVAAHTAQRFVDEIARRLSGGQDFRSSRARRSARYAAASARRDT